VSDLYFCPTVGEIESAGGGGFTNSTCCAHPELHTFIGYSTPAIDAISQYLSDRAIEQYQGPPVHPGQEDPTTIKWVSDADEAKAELKRLQQVARYYRDHQQHLASHRWAETVHTEDDGMLHIPVYAADGTQAEGLVMDREGANTLQVMITDYLGNCYTACHDDCDIVCHEAHATPRKRHHPIGEHPSRGTALDYVAQAVARFDLDNTVGSDYEMPGPDHEFWPLWRASARNAITAYNGYIEQSGHRYLSTGCRHGEHGYCQSNTGSQGDKRPAECKFCAAKCVCSCHFPGSLLPSSEMEAEVPALLPVPESLTTGSDDDWCGAEPPGGAGAQWTAKDGSTGTWGDCYCTKPSGHEGDHDCEPCSQRHGALPWPQTPKEETP
jgi:hypothetical protein